MTSFDSHQQATNIKAATRVLAFFAGTSRVTFDRPRALRTLTEIVRAIPGDDFHTWGQRLVAAGESLDLRIRSTDLSIHEAVKLTRQGIPAVVCFTCESDTGAPVAWWLAIDAVRGRRVHIQTLNDGSERWITVKELMRMLAADGETKKLRWITGQAALPCAVETGGGHVNEGPVKPLERLLGIIQADRGDVWAIVVFSIVVGILALAVPIAVEALVNTVAFGRYLQPIVILSIILLTFLGFAAAIRGLSTFIVEIIQRRFFVRVVEDVAYRLPRVEQEAIDGYYAPELVNRFFDVMTVQKTGAKLLLDGISVVLTTLLGMAVLAFYHPFLLGFDVVLLLCIGFIVFRLGRKAVTTAIAESAHKYKVAAWLEELARHPTAFKLHGGAQFGLDKADKLTVDYLQARRIHFRILMRQILFALGLQAIAATALLGLGGWLVIQRELNLGQLVAAELIVMNIVTSFAKVGRHMEGFYDLLAGVDKLGKLFDLPIERHDKLFHLEDSAPAALQVSEVTQELGGTTFHKGLSFELAPRESLAVVGQAGSGKSLLLDLFTGVRHANQGHITLDRIDIRELRPDSLREHVSLARGIEIFQGTIEENVHLNRPQINASDVREALASVGLLEEIKRLPLGLATDVQTDGAPLTESQCRRLMIARAIVGRPRLLLIDGTLDALSDDLLQETMDHLCDDRRPWTLVVATGRKDIATRMNKTLDLADHCVTRNSEQVGGILS